MQEESGRPYVRRKVTPAYSPIAAEPEGGQNRTKSQGPNIKDILKQSGGLSLSEILQQKNVTLAELLMGKEEAIQALTERTKYKRIPPSIGLHKEGISRRYETISESQDIISSREREEAQKKRLVLLQSPNFPEVTRQEAAAEPTAEATTSTTSQPSTTRTPDGNRLKTGLPLTSAQLMKMVTKTRAGVRPFPTPPPEEEENYPKVNGTLFKPLKISVKEIVKHTENQPGEKQQDGPLRMKIDLKTVDLAPKLEPSSAREEILQILMDPVGRAGLARILEARNMSVQELIEQRERGSSQLHLADIFHNNTREPEPSDEALEGKINSELFSSFPVFARQPKSLSSPTTEQPVPAISFKIPANSSTNATHQWQRLYPDLFSRPNQEQPPKDLVPQRIEEELDILTEEDAQRLDDVDQTLYSSISTQQLDIDENTWQMLNISTGVRSAIVASLVIVLFSIVVFVCVHPSGVQVEAK
uniref:LEM domain-containing protein n=3 Tax=Dendroctonus ponderosae TaxID=77166 RepID=A0AAR5QCX3_DENPD